MSFFICFLLSINSIFANFSQEAVEENRSITDDTWCRYDPIDWTFTLLPLYLLIISVLGIILNVFVLMVFWLHKMACNMVEIYLCNLAAADLILMLSLPFWAVNVLTRFDWNSSETMCKLVPFSISMNGYQQFCPRVYIVVLVSIDRYLALVHPLTYRRKRSPFYSKLACAVVWGVCFLLNVPIIIYREVKHYPEMNVSICILSHSNQTDKVVRIVSIILKFVIPIFVMSFCTLKIIQALRNRLRWFRGSFSIPGKKVRGTAVEFFLAFLICWVPFHVFKILDLLSRYNIVGRCEAHLSLFQQISIFLAFFSSVLSPILYVYVGKNYNQRVKEIFSQMSNKRKSTFILVPTCTNLSSSVKTEDATS
uniref:G-protein coupled receptors family 1 profile domain-containing protein n=1 Tax=Acanthochromis polyacanthus TaxID=80966 RepID=A0A3Q1EPV9_9TELE